MKAMPGATSSRSRVLVTGWTSPTVTSPRHSLSVRSSTESPMGRPYSACRLSAKGRRGLVPGGLGPQHRGHDVAAAGRVELVEDAGHVALGAVQRDPELAADLLVAEAGHEQVEHLALPGAEQLRPPGYVRRSR